MVVKHLYFVLLNKPNKNANKTTEKSSEMHAVFSIYPQKELIKQIYGKYIKTKLLTTQDIISVLVVFCSIMKHVSKNNKEILINDNVKTFFDVRNEIVHPELLNTLKQSVIPTFFFGMSLKNEFNNDKVGYNYDVYSGAMVCLVHGPSFNLFEMIKTIGKTFPILKIEFRIKNDEE